MKREDKKTTHIYALAKSYAGNRFQTFYFVSLPPPATAIMHIPRSLLFFLSCFSLAATISVTTSNELQAALNNVNAGDTITLSANTIFTCINGNEFSLSRYEEIHICIEMIFMRKRDGRCGWRVEDEKEDGRGVQVK